jgi:hypothetical protein
MIFDDGTLSPFAADHQLVAARTRGFSEFINHRLGIADGFPVIRPDNSIQILGGSLSH